MGKDVGRIFEGAEIVSGKLPSLATWERAKKNKVYPKGCTLLQVSATKGQLVYLHEDQTVDSKYCVIIPNGTVEPFYLYRLIELGMPEFLSKEQTGLNIKPDILKRFPIMWHTDPKIQKYIAEEQYFYELQKIRIQKEIDQLEEFKKWLYRWFFC